MREVSEVARIKIHGITKEYPEGITWVEVVRGHQKKYEYDILLIRVNGKLQELHKQVKDCELSLITARDKPGMSIYQRSTSLMVLKAFYNVAGPGNIEKLMIDFSIGRGFLVEARGSFVLDQGFLDAVKTEMRECVERKVPIMKRSVSTDGAIELFEELGMYGKARLFRYRMVSRINIYSIDGFEDYYYGYMVQNTGCIKHFDLAPYHHGFVMAMSNRNAPDILHRFAPSDRLLATLSESTEWGRRMDPETVGALDDRIAKSDMSHLVLIRGALQGGKIAEIAAQIAIRKSACFVITTEPSSFGKTTSSHRLSAWLEAVDLKPHPITVDNYFVNRVDSPRDEHDSYNYEILGCLDVELFNQDITGLLEGRRMELPCYNFKKGIRECKGNFLQLGEGDILVIEGVRYLNDRLSHTLPVDSKLKVYTSALIQLNIDEHNRIPATDGRPLRRAVRDARTRGFSVWETIRMWPSVRRDEEGNIFPFQKEADAMFNSVLIYELAMLKQYAQPLLFAIPQNSEEWLGAKRLLKFLGYFIGVSNEDVPKNSILREFIGGSCLSV